VLSKHLTLFDNDLNWLSTLTEIIKDKAIVKFVVNLDQTYQGIESYLELSEMPGSLLTNILVNNLQAHSKFQNITLSNSLGTMPFFRMCALAQVEGLDECVWSPAIEPLKSFCLKHTDKEVIYFEDKNYKKTIEFFQNQLSKLLSNP